MTGMGRAERERLGELFEHALALPPAGRAAFLEHACRRHTGLYDELTSLLASHVEEPGFLEKIGRTLFPALTGALSDPVLAAGTTIGRYEIIERLGSGGMGVVYKARDPALDRLVALKLLPSNLSADAEARARLQREARAASSLDHPNIAVVYEIGETESAPGHPGSGAVFIAMAYYEGETLKDRITRGDLSIREALNYSIQLADALSRAHGAGIVHRDIKPANVMVTESAQIKIVDFGVAKSARTTASEEILNSETVETGPHRPGNGCWFPVAGSEFRAARAPRPRLGDLTCEGSRLGTVAYMSPEQTCGAVVDHRTDLWSVGVVLYEMLAGVRPFRGEAEEAIVYAIRNEDPAPLERLRPDATPSLARVVERCLAKDPRLRYASAAALLADLRSLTVEGAVDETKPSIIVLPFVDITPDGQNEYFSDGLTEEVIANLSHIRTLRVISRTSAMRLKHTDKDLRAIAHEVGVRYVLEGGVRKAVDALRITVRLVDARRDELLWAHTFNGTVDDVFEIQDQVARAVVDALRIRLSPGEARSMSDRPIPDARAFESYLRARYEAWRFSRDGLARAERYINTALDIVGDNELLYSTLGHIMVMYVEAGIEPGPATTERVDALADKVFALNPESARGHWLKSCVAHQRGDLRAALRAGERALALQPDELDTILWLGYLYAHAGRNEEARALIERGIAIDPLIPLTQCMPGYLAIMEGRFKDAVGPYRRLHAMDPDGPIAWVALGWALAFDCQFDEATAVLHSAADRFHGTAFASWARSLAHGLRGESADAVRAITPAFEAAARSCEMFTSAIADCYALAGEKERALEWLEHDVRRGMLNYPFLAEHNWFLNSVRSEPRFKMLMERVRAASIELGGSSRSG